MQAATNFCVRGSIHDNRKQRRTSTRSSKANLGFIKVPEEVLELMRDDDTKNTYSGGLIAIVVILAILGLIAMATYFTLKDSPEDGHMHSFYFSNIFEAQNLQLSFKYFHSHHNPNYLVFKNSSRAYYKLNLDKIDSIEKIFEVHNDSSDITPSFNFKIWLKRVHPRDNMYNEEEHSYEAFNLKDETIANSSIVKINIIGLENSPETAYFSWLEWTPNEQSLMGVFNNNLYFSKGHQNIALMKCLTCQLNQSRIYGKFVGYYYTEIFRSNRAVFWNEEATKFFVISMKYERDKLLQVERYNHQQLYSKFSNISYAFAKQNPKIYELQYFLFTKTSENQFKIQSIDLNRFFKTLGEFYLVSFKWIATDDKVLLTLLTHTQTRINLMLCDLKLIQCSKIFQQKFSPGCIKLRNFQTIIYRSKTKDIIIAIPASNVHCRSNQIAIINIETKERQWISYEKSVQIIELKHLDNDNWVYFIGINESTNYQQLFKIKLYVQSYQNNPQPVCITCSNSSNSSSPICQINQASFLRSSTWYFQSCLGPNPRTYKLVDLSSTTHSLLLESNKQLFDYLVNISLPIVQFHSIPIKWINHEYFIHCKIHNPSQLNIEHVTKYPVVVMLSDKPNYHEVSNDFDLGYIEYMVSHLGYIVVELDIRGSTSSSTSIFGLNDVHDVLYSVKHILKKFNYMNSTALAVVGSKYGAYLTLQIMQQPQVSFRCGVSIDPITDFKLYDSYFAEKYLELYTENNFVYEKARVKASKEMMKKELIIIQNMHQNGFLFDSTSTFIKQMIEYNILYDYMPIYRRYQYNKWIRDQYTLKKITSFLVNCFNKTSLLYTSLSDTETHMM